MRKKSKFFSKGFTLVEILIAIAIMLVMFMVGYASLSSPKSENKLKAAQREVASAISVAHSNALQGKTVNKILPQYWGFKFVNNKKYQIFNWDGSSPSDSMVEEYTLSNGVTLSDPADFNDSRITFSTPNGIAGGATLPLTLTLSLSGSIKTITINSAGVVSEN